MGNPIVPPYSALLASWQRRREEIRRLHSLGLSYAAIGRALGISKQAAAQACRNLPKEAAK